MLLGLHDTIEEYGRISYMDDSKEHVNAPIALNMRLGVWNHSLYEIKSSKNTFLHALYI